MIRKLSVPEILDAIRNLDPIERAVVIAALENPLAVQEDASRTARHDPWTAVAAAGLSRAYGDSEPDYCDADLAP
jgi:hypothetical protein